VASDGTCRGRGGAGGSAGGQGVRRLEGGARGATGPDCGRAGLSFSRAGGIRDAAYHCGHAVAGRCGRRGGGGTRFWFLVYDYDGISSGQREAEASRAPPPHADFEIAEGSRTVERGDFFRPDGGRMRVAVKDGDRDCNGR